MTRHAHFTCSPFFTFPSSSLAKIRSNDQQATKLRKQSQIFKYLWNNPQDAEVLLQMNPGISRHRK